MKTTATIKQVRDMERGRRYRVYLDPAHKGFGATRDERLFSVTGVFTGAEGIAIDGDPRNMLGIGWTFGLNIVGDPAHRGGRKSTAPAHPCKKDPMDPRGRWLTHAVIAIEELDALELTDDAIDAMELEGLDAAEAGDVAAADLARFRLRLIASLVDYTAEELAARGERAEEAADRIAAA